MNLNKFESFEKLTEKENKNVYLLLAFKYCKFLFNLSVQFLERPLTKIDLVISSAPIANIDGGSNGFVFILINRSFVKTTTVTTFEQLLSEKSLQSRLEATFTAFTPLATPALHRCGVVNRGWCVGLDGHLLADLLVHLRAFLVVFGVALGHAVGGTFLQRKQTS